MTSIERTAYPRFTRAPSVKELRENYTPTPTDVAFVATTARGPAQKFGLMIFTQSVPALGLFSETGNHPRSDHRSSSSGDETPGGFGA